MSLKKSQLRTGVIRGYDMNAPSVKIGLMAVYFLCALVVVISLFPIVWVMLAGFKDLREFMSNPAILPQAFDLSRYAKTWTQLNIQRNYLNSFYAIAGSVVSR